MSRSADVWTPVYVALGSNLADPVAQLRRAAASLSALRATRLVALSRLYVNPPLGVVEQPDFVNAVAGLVTRLDPAEFLAELQAIEREQGRRPGDGQRWGPRVIDLDLLMHGLSCCHEAALVLPHPGIAQRNFVLFPLLEIAPAVEIPGLGTVAALATRLDREQLRPVH